jgi:dTDP-4-amino-4,6-dideoxygalactose transaminase
MMTAYKNAGYDIKDYPQAYQNFACEISLPVFFGMTHEEMNYVMDVLIESVEDVLGIVHEEIV